MRQETRELIDQLGEKRWFDRVGKYDLGRGIIRVHSWDEAIEACSEVSYENLHIETTNNIRHGIGRERLNRWNDVVDQVKPDVQYLVNEKLHFWRGLIKDLESVRMQAEWDILGACLESEYSPLVESHFLRGIAAWYGKGHFPCGWSGTISTGSPIVF